MLRIERGLRSKIGEGKGGGEAGGRDQDIAPNTTTSKSAGGLMGAPAENS